MFDILRVKVLHGEIIVPLQLKNYYSLYRKKSEMNLEGWLIGVLESMKLGWIPKHSYSIPKLSQNVV